MNSGVALVVKSTLDPSRYFPMGGGVDGRTFVRTLHSTSGLGSVLVTLGTFPVPSHLNLVSSLEAVDNRRRPLRVKFTFSPTPILNTDPYYFYRGGSSEWNALTHESTRDVPDLRHTLHTLTLPTLSRIS